MKVTAHNNPASLISEAKEIGALAANGEIVTTKPGQSVDDNIHHVGDDTGELITDAYRLGGAELAADVLDAYFAEFNRVRSTKGWTELSPTSAVKHLRWAIKSDGITPDEQKAVQDTFTARHP
ncbi:hypothetical protein [Yimella sp. cx-51]|uniref:hypothetical protein n=1 Tax=Yimella sp. cx-51 TaxID=2770551 RepID=UPI00165E8822|nr:hypothetical protein [Yimella sp. cx-51]MBC9958368.1 hypothetical protein [Yimella sp. cx-51]QTH39751.1 hypothetical protein J5M86_15160 [Yimella sp. cx-51]